MPFRHLNQVASDVVDSAIMDSVGAFSDVPGIRVAFRSREPVRVLEPRLRRTRGFVATQWPSTDGDETAAPMRVLTDFGTSCPDSEHRGRAGHGSPAAAAGESPLKSLSIRDL